MRRQSQRLLSKYVPGPHSCAFTTLEVNMAAHCMLSRVLVSSGKFISLRTVSSSFRPEGMFNSYFSSSSQCKEFFGNFKSHLYLFLLFQLTRDSYKLNYVDFYCKWVVIIRAYLWKLTASILTKEAEILMRGLIYTFILILFAFLTKSIPTAL